MASWCERSLHVGDLTPDDASTRFGGAWGVCRAGSFPGCRRGACKQQRPTLKITFCDSSLDAVTDAHTVVLITEWEEFRDLDLAEVAARATKPVFIDGRNFFSPEAALLAGLDYSGIGRVPLRAAKERTGQSRPATVAPAYTNLPVV